MPIGNGGIPDKVFQFSIFQVAWHHLALGERTKRGGVAYLTAEFHAGYSGLHIIWVRQKIRLNLNGIERIGPRQTNTAPLFCRTTTPNNVQTAPRKPKFALFS